MASKLAVEIESKLYHHTDRLRDRVDESLQEVREVLGFFQRSRDCWCVSLWKGKHEPRCDRARTLLDRLRIKEQGDG